MLNHLRTLSSWVSWQSRHAKFTLQRQTEEGKKAEEEGEEERNQRIYKEVC